VRELVRKSGFSDPAICYHARISFSTLAKLESGARRNPSTDLLIRLASVLGCQVGDFFDEDDAGQPVAS
jgi:transcriptional regulator with XRE-family HTH domain